MWVHNALEVWLQISHCGHIGKTSVLLSHEGYTGPVPFIPPSVYPSVLSLPLHIPPSVCIVSLTYHPPPIFWTLKFTLLPVAKSWLACNFFHSPSVIVTDQACFLPVRFVSLYFVCNLTETSIPMYLYQLM